jgi:site-specific DNA recombinase
LGACHVEHDEELTMIAAIYSRKSNDQHGVADEAKSVSRQIDHARAYALKKGWTIADDHIYVDDGISGAEFANRPGFVRLMNAVAAKPRPFDVLVMSEESRLGREQIETSYATKKIVTAGIRVFFYLTDCERKLETPIDKLLMSVTAFADEMEREKIRLRVYDGMLRRARSGYWNGGRVFGYVNTPVYDDSGRRSHVALTINETEAAVVRRIFRRCAEGAGVKRIAHELNLDQAPCPKPHQGRRASWAVSTVRSVLDRDLYRGRMTWNKQQKKNTWGQRENTARPPADWLTVAAPQLRVVSDEEFSAAHRRLAATAATYLRGSTGQALGKPPSGIEARHLLTGLAACGACGGGIMARHAGRTASGRRAYYICTSYNNHGATACANNLPLPLQLADQAVLSTLSDYILRPDIVQGAIEDAVAALRPSTDTMEAQRASLEAQLRTADEEAARLAEALARGGNLGALLDKLQDRERQRAHLRQQLDGLAGLRQVSAFDVKQVETLLRVKLADWKALLQRQTPLARQVVTKLLAGRLVFTPRPANRAYEFTGQVQLGRILQGIVLPQVLDRFVDTTAQNKLRELILEAFQEHEERAAIAS